MKCTTRRSFIKHGAFKLALFGGLLKATTGCKEKRKKMPGNSKVVRIFNKDATDNSGAKNNESLNNRIIRMMVDDAVKAYTDSRSIKDAWARVIPDETKKVAIKVNCQTKGIYTKSKVVHAIVDGLLRRGVDENNIIIYDLTDNAFELAGFKKNTGAGIKIGKISELGGFSEKKTLPSLLPWKTQHFCKVLAGEGPYGCDYLINVPVIKALDGFSGVTMSLKNHFGSIDKPRALHKNIHRNICRLNSHELIYNKTRLVVADGIFTLSKWNYENTRSLEFVEETNTLLVSKDPVAIDTVGSNMIAKLRQERGVPPIGPDPKFIEYAAADGLGQNLSKRIELIDA